MIDQPYADFAADLSKLQIAEQAQRHYKETESYQQGLVSRYRRLHHYYAPWNADQWPEDLALRPDKIHITSNVCKPFCDVDARLQALVPRLSCKANGTDIESRKKADAAEKTISRFLEISDWDVWLAALARVKVVYGKAVLKPYWNTEEDRPDVIVVEALENLRIGWGASDFSVVDWALYEYAISPVEARRRWPDVEIEHERTGWVIRRMSPSDHTDPLNQMQPIAPSTVQRPPFYQPSDYEGDQMRVWDYWFIDETGVVTNAMLLEGTVVDGPHAHKELIDIPYIVIENDHEPGMPEGIATHEHILDLQYELNRALSHWAQIVADETDPAWQLNGPEADSIPPGVIPKAGQVVAPGGGNSINPISKGINLFPVQQLVDEIWQNMHRTTGISEVAFGITPGAQTAGRALAVQIESVANRLDFKRRLLYKGLRRLIMFWIKMLEEENPKIKLQVDVPGETDPTTGEQAEGTTEEVTLGIGDVVRGFYRWSVVPPEITPRDVYEQTTNLINQVQAKVISLNTARDLLGYDSPEDEEELVIAERSNAHLFPGEVQTYVATMAALQEMQQRQQMQEQATAGVAGAQNAVGQGAATAEAQNGQPTGVEADTGLPQPQTVEGGPPPGAGPGANSPISQTTLVRSQPNGQAVAMNQLAYNRKIGG
jgi:hypothetical protein